MKSLHIIIFSFNRALQLDALLQSIHVNLKGKFKVSVLYNTSNDLFQRGYEKLKEENPTVSFIKENRNSFRYPSKLYFSLYNIKKLIRHPYIRKPKSNFRDKLIELVSLQNGDYTMFMTDDSLFTRETCLSDDIYNLISKSPTQNSFALRLGLELNNPPSSVRPLNESVLFWNYYNTGANLKNWNYPFSVDAHIYDTNFIKELSEKLVFMNPSSYECILCDYVCKHKLLSNGYSFQKYCLLSFPINIVQEVEDNESLNCSVEDLNNYFLEGYTLEYPIIEKADTFQQYPSFINLKKNGEIVKIDF